MMPLFAATERFDPSDGLAWINYVQWAKIPNLVEIVSLDGVLCKTLLPRLEDEDWKHNIHEDYRLNYFLHLDYLLKRVADVTRRNVLGLYRNPDYHVDESPAAGDFAFTGYDLIEEATQISALTNCGGFPETFSNSELNKFGLILEFARANEIRKLLRENNPQEQHANCEMYAVWRLEEGL